MQLLIPWKTHLEGVTLAKLSQGNSQTFARTPSPLSFWLSHNRLWNPTNHLNMHETATKIRLTTNAYWWNNWAILMNHNSSRAAFKKKPNKLQLPMDGVFPRNHNICIWLTTKLIECESSICIEPSKNKHLLYLTMIFLALPSNPLGGFGG